MLLAASFLAGGWTHHRQNPTHTVTLPPEIVRVEVPATATANPGATASATPSESPDPATPSPTASSIGPITPEASPTPIVIERVVRVSEPPYPCLVTSITTTLTVAEQVVVAASEGVLICDPDSMVVPRTRLID